MEKQEKEGKRREGQPEKENEKKHEPFKKLYKTSCRSSFFIWINSLQNLLARGCALYNEHTSFEEQLRNTSLGLFQRALCFSRHIIFIYCVQSFSSSHVSLPNASMVFSFLCFVRIFCFFTFLLFSWFSMGLGKIMLSHEANMSLHDKQICTS